MDEMLPNLHGYHWERAELIMFHDMTFSRSQNGLGGRGDTHLFSDSVMF